MVPSGLFTQIAMIGLSVGIVITYIMPTFDEIKLLQDNISDHQIEIAKDITLSVIVSTSWIMPRRVVDLPYPVGPDTKIIP